MPGPIKSQNAAQPQWAELALVKRVVSDKTTSVDKVFKQIESTKELGIFDRFLHFLGKHGIFSGKRWVPVAKTDEGKFVWAKVETLVDKTHLSKKEIKQVLKGASKTHSFFTEHKIEHDMHTALSKKDADEVCRLLEQTPVTTEEIKAFLKNAVIDSDVWMKELSKKQFKAKPEQKPLYEALILYVRLTPPPSSEENKAIALQLVHQAQLSRKTFDEKTIQSNQFLSPEQKASMSKEVTDLQQKVTQLQQAHAVPSGKKAFDKDVSRIVNMYKVAKQTLDEEALIEIQAIILSKLVDFMKGGNNWQQLQTALSKEQTLDEEAVLEFEEYLKNGIMGCVIGEDNTLNVQEYKRLLFQAVHSYPDMLEHFAALANAQKPGPDKNEALTALFAARAIVKEQESF